MDRNEWNARYASQELVWGAAPNRFVAEIVEPLPPGRALDLACGEGRNAVWLAHRGWHVTAIDFADVAITKAQARAEADGLEIEWVVDDVLEYTPPVRAFDLVLLAYLQLPAPERDRVWDQAAAAVADGGTFVMVGHDSRNLHDGYGGPTEASVLYAANDVVGHLDALTVVRASEVERIVTTPLGDDRTAIDCLVVATPGVTGSSGVVVAIVVDRALSGALDRGRSRGEHFGPDGALDLVEHSSHA